MNKKKEREFKDRLEESRKRMRKDDIYHTMESFPLNIRTYHAMESFPLNICTYHGMESFKREITYFKAVLTANTPDKIYI